MKNPSDRFFVEPVFVTPCGERVKELEAQLAEARALVREMKDALAIEGYDYYFDGRIDKFLAKE